MTKERCDDCGNDKRELFPCSDGPYCPGCFEEITENSYGERCRCCGTELPTAYLCAECMGLDIEEEKASS